MQAINGATPAPGVHGTDAAKALDALHRIPPDLPRDEWVKVGMGAHAAGLDFDAFDAWSAGADNYDARAARDTWRSFKAGKGVGAGTLFRVAAEHGQPMRRPLQAPRKAAAPPQKPAPGMAPAEVWARCLPATAGHPYVLEKGISGAPLEGLRVLPAGDSLRIAGQSMAGALVVPAHGPHGLQSLQLIPPPGAGKKLNLPGAPMAGASFVVGEALPGAPLYLCEGVGAAWACWQATGHAAAVCFGWGNVARIAADLRQKDAAAQLVLVPDTGKEESAAKIALEAGCAVAYMPEGEANNFDANDLSMRDGHDVLAELLERAQAPQKAPAKADDSDESPFGSELALSEEFARNAHGTLRWTPGLEWMVNSGTHWKKDESLRRFTAAKAVCKGAAAGLESAKLAGKICSAGTHSAILSLARSADGIVTEVEEWDKHPMLLNTPAGVIDLETGREVSRAGLLFTQVAGASPAATPTPIWDKFIREVFDGDLEMVEFMQRMGGYSLTGSIKEQKLFFLHGNGANGKSVFLDVLRAIGGQYSYNLPSEALMTSKHESHPTMLASLHGKRLAISSEIEESAHWAEARIKAMTGDETMTARYMRQDFFTFRVSHKHIIAGNFKPRLKGDDFAMVRRMVLIPFSQRFEGARRDNNLPDKLKAEYPGILAWFIEGARKWAVSGLAIPAAITEASQEYMAEQDDIGLWIESRCERVPGHPELASSLFASFESWKRDNGEHAGSAKTFSQRLERSYDKKATNKGKVFKGLRLSSQFDSGNTLNPYEEASRGR